MGRLNLDCLNLSGEPVVILVFSTVLLSFAMVERSDKVSKITCARLEFSSVYDFEILMKFCCFEDVLRDESMYLNFY